MFINLLRCRPRHVFTALLKPRAVTYEGNKKPSLLTQDHLMAAAANRGSRLAALDQLGVNGATPSATSPGGNEVVVSSLAPFSTPK
jgi:hypothetical protein